MKECAVEPAVRTISAYTLSDEYEPRFLGFYGEPTTKDGNWSTWTVENAGIPSEAFVDKKTLTRFVFPEGIEYIGGNAFHGTNLSGALVLPEGIREIMSDAFSSSLVNSVSFPSTLIIVDQSAFTGCSSLSSELLFPNGLSFIGDCAFYLCRGLSGTKLHLPDGLRFLGNAAFSEIGSMVGNLVIPEKIRKLRGYTFSATSFTGSLDLSNVLEIGVNDFWYSGFSGPLIIPEGIIEIPYSGFYSCGFSSITFPSSLRRIGDFAFQWCESIVEPLVLPEGLITIDRSAFEGSRSIPSIVFPSTIQSIGDCAFNSCYNVSSIVCDSAEPPSVGSDAFFGVAKDNFTVEVPAQSVKRYQAETGWGDFKRIAAHYDFSLSRKQMRALNGSMARTFVLRAPANYSWSIQEKPDWVTVEPSFGTGKTDVTITVADMALTTETFEINEGRYNNPNYVSYKGRSGQVIFQLDDKDYTFAFDVEQYDYDFPDGYVQTIQSASHGPGIDIVFTGDGYDARDIAKGTFIDNAEAGYRHLFDVEPFKTYKDYFNVYAVTALSDESGIGSLNTIVDTKFNSTFTQNRVLLQSQDEVFAWAKKADSGMDLTKSLVILLQNTSTYEGITYMYTDGSAIACCPVSTQAYPYDFRGIVQHEAGGHGFGKLGDEYIYHNAFIQNCLCLDGCEHPQGDDDLMFSYGIFKSLGWYKNLSMTSDAKRVPWAHLIYNPQYSDYVDMYEGGYMHSRGMYRSEATSCMNNNIPYFSAISRQAIVERIKFCAGEEFSLEDFYANDNDDFGPTRVGGKYAIDRTFGVDPHLNHTSGHGPILVGDHPNVK